MPALHQEFFEVSVVLRIEVGVLMKSLSKVPHTAPPTDANLLRVLLRGMRKTGVAILYQDNSLNYIVAENLPEGWPASAEFIDKGDAAVFSADVVSRVDATKREVLQSGQPTRIEVPLSGDAGRQWYALSIEPDIGQNGHIVGLFSTIMDIGDIKRREEVLRALLREVSHRSKNLLAIIQSIATQTAKSSPTIETFLLAFRGRVHSLAHSQDLVTASDWRGADLCELAYAQVRLFAERDSPLFRISGVDAHLLPNAALHLGLAIHELAVNSAAKGVLAVSSGEIELRAQEMVAKDGEARLVVSWTESFDPDKVPNIYGEGPSEEGRKTRDFAKVVLGRVVPQALSADVEYEVEPGYVRYVLRIPPTQYERT
ncbi:histidine kinase [Stappia sp. GBMRC 2046]|uniref:histidine kinase n=1 Tax=Stappia sediminis TaxID=2692190 RepID=A0A7X3S629_9HYPH|nr:sensor histidine kinase [Stappia sediminis]MXN63643.1 histidine kinase [Stappia sediminis]